MDYLFEIGESQTFRILIVLEMVALRLGHKILE